jgi:ParB family chromosome partitioning protein
MSRDIDMAVIDPDPQQPRQCFDATSLAELGASMQAQGLLQPILLRPVGDRYVVVHGERRLRAARSLGWQTIAAEVKEVSPEEAPFLALVENLQRADLTPLEEAGAYHALLKAGVTQTVLAKRIGKHQTHIATMLRLLTLPATVQGELERGRVTVGHAKQLLRLKDHPQQELVCQQALREP